jgi:3-phenylpropionate/cinnamic acid dioxygenase small subunit
MANGSTADKARKARLKAEDAKYMWRDSERLANKIAKTATGKDLTMDEESRAGTIIQNRRINDTGRTAARASFIERRTAKKAAASRMNAAVGGAPAKKQAPKPAAKATTKATTKKVAPAKPKAGLPKTGRQNMKKAGK